MTTTPPQTTSWLTGLRRLLVALALAALLAYLLIYLRYTVALLQFPFDYDQGEGFELNDTVLLAQGQWPYQNNEQYPFYSSNYPPLYHLVLVPFAWVFGPAYWYGRLWSFLATLVTAGAIGWAVLRQGRIKWIAAAAGLLYLSSNYVYHIGPLFRQHITMVMLETLAIVILSQLKHVDDPDADPSAERKRLLWALGLLLAAGYTKQLAYATVIVAFIYIATKGLRRAIIAGVIFTAVGLALFGLLNLATGGEWWFNIVIANINEFVPGQFAGLFRQWYDLHAPLIWLSLAWIVFDTYRQRRLSVYSLWFIGAVANSTLAGKWGAGESYFVTAIAAGCICTGLMLSDLHRLATERATTTPTHALSANLMLLLLPLLVLAQAARLVHLPTQGRLFAPIAQLLDLPTDQPYYDSQGYTQLGRPPNAIDTEQGYKLLAYVQASEGPVMTEEAAFSLLAGKQQVGNPTQLLNLDRAGLLDPEPLILALESQKFDVIILKAEFYPRKILDAIGQNYQSIATEPMNGFFYRVLVPKE